MTNDKSRALELIAAAIGPNRGGEKASGMDLVCGIRMLSEVGLSDQQILALPIN